MEEENKEEKYKRKQCRKEKPFFKWLFSKRDSKYGRINSLLIFTFLLIFNIGYGASDNFFSQYGGLINIPMVWLTGVLGMMIVGRIAAASDKSGSTIVNIFTMKIKKKFIIDCMGLSLFFFSTYILFIYLILTLGIFLPTLASLIISTGCLYTLSIILNYSIEIDQDAKDLKLKKDDLREMRLQEILGKDGSE